MIDLLKLFKILLIAVLLVQNILCSQTHLHLNGNSVAVVDAGESVVSVWQWIFYEDLKGAVWYYMAQELEGIPFFSRRKEEYEKKAAEERTPCGEAAKRLKERRVYLKVSIDTLTKIIKEELTKINILHYFHVIPFLLQFKKLAYCILFDTV
ncbi:hypothetical protein BDF20DRAFT_881088 [Mycotypha africana]|uniref:uncharacterized protein n=1 Tax=Mycotypha africana TaxID=64632 RepID=UPI0023006C4C|nr:uncharacterized protein BDF20DRAFT_881088 [Mycotypha africana]KAI8973221.1 hypothetical protein BDF20DRAFT_881088 [Mycotypha africana]